MEVNDILLLHLPGVVCRHIVDNRWEVNDTIMCRP